MNSLRFLSVVSLALVAAPLAVFAQGTLAPAGAPAPMMKTLSQVESRTDVNTLPGDATAMHVISQPGSYYLTADVNGVAGKGGIRIAASDVHLDLNGFTLRGSGVTSLRGIFTADADEDPHYAGLNVHGGSVVNWGGSGIHPTFVDGVQISNVRVSSCGGMGIYLVGGASRIVDCMVEKVKGAGIYVYSGAGGDPLIRGCIVTGVQHVSLAHGIFAGYGVVENCRVRAISGVGAKGIEVGLRTGRVADCDVSQVGSGTGGTAAVGIDAALIQGCNISDIGTLACSGYGIYPNYPGSVIDCRISDVTGVNAFGIYSYYAKDDHNNNAAFLVRSCSVMNIDAGTGGVGGIFARMVVDCQVSSVRGANAGAPCYGISTHTGGLVNRCTVQSVEGHGIDVQYPATITGNTVSSAGSDGSGAGISIAVTGCRIEGNRVSSSPIGFLQSGASSLVISNFAMGNTTNYSGVFAGSIVTTQANLVASSSVMNVSF